MITGRFGVFLFGLLVCDSFHTILGRKHDLGYSETRFASKCVPSDCRVRDTLQGFKGSLRPRRVLRAVRS